MFNVEYIAGFFDGEGSIGLYKNGQGTYHLRTQLTQNVNKFSTMFLNYLMNIYGGNLTQQITSHGIKYNWQLNSEKAVMFLQEIEPFLFFKKEQSEIARAWWTLKPKQSRDNNGRYIKLTCNLDEKCAQLIKLLKKNDIDKVMQAQSDLVEIMYTLKQVLCVKG